MLTLGFGANDAACKRKKVGNHREPFHLSDSRYEGSQNHVQNDSRNSGNSKLDELLIEMEQKVLCKNYGPSMTQMWVR